MGSYSIKDLADKIGVSKQAIRYKIDSIGIIYKRDDAGTIKISEKEAIKLFDSYGLVFNEQERKGMEQSNAFDLVQLQHENEMLKLKLENKEELIINLRVELAEARESLKQKDELIKQANNQLATLADQAQRLQLKQIEAPKIGFWARIFKS